MSTVWEVVEDSGVQVSISAAGRAACAADATRHEEQQRLARVDRLYVQIRIAALGGALGSIAVLAITKILGA